MHGSSILYADFGVAPSVGVKLQAAGIEPLPERVQQKAQTYITATYSRGNFHADFCGCSEAEREDNENWLRSFSMKGDAPIAGVGKQRRMR